MSIDALREILAEVYGIKTEAELDEAIRKMKKLDISLFTASIHERCPT